MPETNTQKILRILLTPAAALESTMLQVLYLRSIDTAVGAQLDAIGTLVGRAREGVTDDDIYRRYCRSQITANKSDGLIEDVLTVVELVVDDDAAALVLDNAGAAAFMIRIDGVSIAESVADVLADSVGKATSGGVRSIIEYTTGPSASRMRWGTGTWGQNWSRARNTGQ